jgi:hypothetical protein
VSLAPILAHESRRVHLLAVTSLGARLYFALGTGGSAPGMPGTAGEGRPTRLTLMRVLKAPETSTRVQKLARAPGASGGGR